MMQTDVLVKTAAAGTTTLISANPARIKGILINYVTSGTLTINDGTGGTAKFTYTAPATAGIAGSVYVAVPGEGVLCRTNISAVAGAGLTAQVFYG
jgi:hypothetical protein